MPTPVARSPLNSYEGISPDDLNQLLGTHAPVVTYDNATALIASSAGGNTTPPQYQYQQPLVSAAGQPVSVDQPVTMSGTVLDRVELPLNVKSGVGQDVLVGLYADSAGAPTGLPLVQTYVPKEMIPAAGTNEPGHGLIMSPAQVSHFIDGLMTPPSPYDTYTAPGFVSDGVVAIFVGGLNASNVTTTGTIIGLLSASNGEVTQWNAGPAYPVSLCEQGAAVDTNSYVYVVGGMTGASVPSTAVYSALYSSLPPTIGAWQAQTVLPVSLVNNSCIIISSSTTAAPILYSVGGIHATPTCVSSVYAASLSSPGLIGSWASPSGSQFPTTIASAALVQINGYLVAIGGITNDSIPTYTTAVWAAKINSDNTLSAWRPWPAIPVAGQGTAVVYGNSIVFTGENYGYSIEVSALGQPDPVWQSCTQEWTDIVGSPQPYGPLTCLAGNWLMNFNGSTSPGTVGGIPTTPCSTPLFFSSMMSVPLHATGLSNATKYHIIVSPLGDTDQYNVTQLAMCSSAPTGSYAAGQLEVGAAAGFATTVSALPSYMGSAVSRGWDTASGRYSLNATVTYASNIITMTAIANATANIGGMAISTLNPNPATSSAGGSGIGGIDLSGQYALPVIPGASYTFSATIKTAATVELAVIAVEWCDANGVINGYITPNASGNDSVGGVNLSCSGVAPQDAVFAALQVDVDGASMVAGEVHTVSNLVFAQNYGYVPMSLYVSGKNLRPIHVLDDIVNTQPDAWNWITYDYSGKPIQIGEVIMPRVNLISPNDSNLGGPVKGTAANWAVGANCTLSVVSPATQPLGAPASVTPSAPAFPIINSQQCAYALALTSVAGGDMSALSLFGTSGVPVTVGQHYTAFAYFLAAAHARSCTVTINWYTAAGSACAHPSDAGSAVVDSTTGWVQAYVNAVAPATAAFAAVVVVAAATGGASEVHDVTCVSFHLDNSLNSGMALPMLAYFEPGAGPGGMRNLITLGYDSATSQLVSVTPNNPLTYFGTGLTTTYQPTGMIDTQAVWPMNGLVGQVITAPSDLTAVSNSATTTATVLFNTGTVIILTAAGWSNGQPADGSSYSIT